MSYLNILMNLNTVSIEDFHRYIYENYTKKSISSDLYFNQGYIIHRIYEHGRLDLLQAISTTYGPRHLSKKNESGDTILHTAVKTSKINTQQLVSFGADLDIYDTYGSTPLHYICSRYDVAFVRSLESKDPINANQEDGDGYLPAFIALIEGDFKLFIYLLDHTMNINHTDSMRNTMLHYACWLNRLDAVNALLKYDVCKTYKNMNGLTPYDMATEPYIKLLISGKTADMNSVTCSKCELGVRMPYEFKCGHVYCYECLVHSIDVHDTNRTVGCQFDCKSATDVSLSDIIGSISDIDPSNHAKYYHYKFNKILANALIGNTNIRYLDSLVVISDNVHLVLSRKKEMLAIKVIYQSVYKSYSEAHRLQLLKGVLCISKQSIFLIYYGSLQLNGDRLSSTISLRLDILNYNEIGEILQSVIAAANWIHHVLSSSSWDAELTLSAHDNNIYPIYHTPIHMDRFLIALGTKAGLSYTLPANNQSVIILDDNGLRIKLQNYSDMQAIVIYTHVASIRPDHIQSYEYLVTYKPFIELSNFRLQVLSDGDVLMYSCVNYVHHDLSMIKPAYNTFRKECCKLKKLMAINCAILD